MGQIKARLTIEHQSSKKTFSNREELLQDPVAQLLLERLTDLQLSLQKAAASHLLQQTIGLENIYLIQYSQESD